MERHPLIDSYKLRLALEMDCAQAIGKIDLSKKEQKMLFRLNEALTDHFNGLRMRWARLFTFPLIKKIATILTAFQDGKMNFTQTVRAIAEVPNRTALSSVNLKHVPINLPQQVARYFNKAVATAADRITPAQVTETELQNMLLSFNSPKEAATWIVSYWDAQDNILRVSEGNWRKHLIPSLSDRSLLYYMLTQLLNLAHEEAEKISYIAYPANPSAGTRSSSP